MFKSLLKDSSGNVAILLAVASAALISTGGAAVEFSHWNSAQADLFGALDTAVLAGTKELSESGNSQKAITVADEFFAKAISSNQGYAKLAISFKLNQNKNGLAATGAAEVKTSILSAFGISSIPLVSPSEAELVAAEATPPGGADAIEVSLMLDVTGSMCDDGIGPCSSGSKISALKSAASGLTDKLIPSSSSGSSLKTKTRVALVPFSTRVRLDSDGSDGLIKQVTNLDSSWTGFYDECLAGTSSGSASETNGVWTCTNRQVNQVTWKVMPCVTDRYFDSTDNFDFTDSRPSAGNWLNGHDGSRMPLAHDSTDSPATTKLGLSAADPADWWNYDPTGSCADVGNGDKVVALSDSRSSLLASINGLSAFGATSGALGTAFSWYTLSPDWADIWGSSSAPGPYSDLSAPGVNGAKKLRKIAVLMTDGAYNTYRGWKEQSAAKVGGGAKIMCQNMKNLGIEIFTVGFSLNSLTPVEAASAQDVLTSCASDASHFVDAASTADLVKAFDDIGSMLVASEIRLVK